MVVREKMGHNLYFMNIQNKNRKLIKLDISYIFKISAVFIRKIHFE